VVVALWKKLSMVIVHNKRAVELLSFAVELVVVCCQELVVVGNTVEVQFELLILC
jgi:hypothetical protein